MGDGHPHKAPAFYLPDYRSASVDGSHKKRADCLQEYGIYFISTDFGKLRNNGIVVSIPDCQRNKNGNQVADSKPDGRAQ